jgi:hypothetical protein
MDRCYHLLVAQVVGMVGAPMLVAVVVGDCYQLE